MAHHSPIIIIIYKYKQLAIFLNQISKSYWRVINTASLRIYIYITDLMCIKISDGIIRICCCIIKCYANGVNNRVTLHIKYFYRMNANREESLFCFWLSATVVSVLQLPPIFPFLIQLFLRGIRNHINFQIWS